MSLTAALLLALPAAPLAQAAAPAPSAEPAPAADGAGNRLEPLRLQTGSNGEACTADGSWGVGLATGDDAPDLSVRRPQGTRRYPLPDLPAGTEGADGDTVLWPQRIVLAGTDALILGVITEQRAMYSGGGASASQLHLLRLAPAAAGEDGDGAPAVLLATLPWDGNSMIRACFSEVDMRKRAGACHDEYEYAATLALAPGGTPGVPVLRYASVATSYPGPVSRSRDSLAGRPLRKRDLVRVTDRQCSVTRLLHADPATHAYRVDTPLPDCADYTQP